MEKEKAERESFKKKKRKKDTYTFFDSMVLQQVLVAIKVHVLI